MAIPNVAHVVSNRCGKTITKTKCTESMPYWYGVFFAVAFVYLASIGHTGLFGWIILAFNCTLLCMGRHNEAVLYSSFLLQNEFVSLINIILWIFLARDDKLSSIKIPKSILWLVSILMASSFINAALSKTIPNVVIALAYYLFLAMIFRVARNRIDTLHFLRVNRPFIIAEMIISLYLTVTYGASPGDAHCGSLGNAHLFGIWCCVSLVVLWQEYRRVGMARGVLFVYVIALVVMLSQADAKAVLVAGVFGIVVWLVVRRCSVAKNAISATFVILAALLILGVGIFNSPAIEHVLTEGTNQISKIARDNIYGDTWSLKFRYITGTVEKLVSTPRGLVGYGLGQYGSRFANLCGYEETYREESTINELVAGLIPSNMNKDYAEYASQYNNEMVSQIQWHSAVASYPFSNLVSILAEGGLIGVALVALLLAKMHIAPAGQLVMAFFLGICITDLYLEHVQSAALIFVVVGIFALNRNPSCVPLARSVLTPGYCR